MPYNTSHTLDVQQHQDLNLGVEESGSQVSIAGAAALAKARMAAEEASHEPVGGHGHNPSLENVSSITGDSVSSPLDTATPPYRSRSERHRRGGGAQRSPSSSSSNAHHRHWRGAFGSGTLGTETAPSLITTSSSESSRRYPSTSRRHYHSQRRRGNGDGDSIDSGSISARTLAQTAAPNLSEMDIDRLAESIVARIHGRDPTLTEQAMYRHAGNPSAVGVRSSVLSEGEEPPPPWSAPVAGRV